jgi:hypothetical protein
VKVLPLISTVLLAISLAGAAPAVHAAAPAAAAASNFAPATIELVQCDANASAPCGINSKENKFSKTADSDLHALPSTDPKQQAADPAAPVPEPQTFVMLMLGLVVLGFASRRRVPSEKFKG